MATSGPRVSWNIQNKVLHIGIETRGREHRWKLSPNSAGKAEILREIADVLDPPRRGARRSRPQVVEHYGDEYYDDDEEDDEEEWDRTAAHSRPRRRRPANQQVAQPYPAVDPQGQFGGDALEIIEHSRGYLPDGSPIRSAVPQDPAERASRARLSQQAYEKAQAHAGAVSGQDETVHELPIIEARPKAERRTRALDSQGRGFLPPPPSDTPGVTGDVQVRVRPKIHDPQFYYKDTH